MAINKIIIENSSGNVGIGTTNPGARLHIAASGEGVLQIQDTDSANLNFFLGKNGAESYFLSRNGSANGHFAWYTSDGTTTTARMRLTETGNFGIGTTSPQGIFEASGGVSYFSRATKSFILNPNYAASNTHTQLQAPSGLALRLATNGDNDRMTITSAGDVGIGVTNPIAKTEINLAGGLAFRAYYGSGANRCLDINIDKSNGDARILWNANNTTGSTYAYITNNYSAGIISGDGLGFLVAGSGTAGANITYTQALTILSGGNVGVGTNNPSQKIEAYGTDSGIIAHYVGNSRGGIFALESQKFALGTTASADDILFGYGPSPMTSAGFVERMRVDNGTGNVGIGTTNPTAKLDVAVSSTMGTYGPGTVNFILRNTNTAETNSGAVDFTGHSGNGVTPYQWALISAEKQTSAGDGNYGGKLHLWTTSGGGSGEVNSGSYRRLTIDSSGRVGIGTTAPAERLDIYGGRVKIASGSNGYGWIYGLDTNHSIILRGDRNGNIADFTNYHQYGGNLADGKGHRFWTGGVLASQTEKFRICDDAVSVYTTFTRGINYWSDSPGSYSAGGTTVQTQYGPEIQPFHGWKELAIISTRAFHDYMDIKTNITSDNIMFWFKFMGYNYGYGNTYYFGGGYTYVSDVINKSMGTGQKLLGNAYVYDLYRATADNALCVKIYLGHQGYTEGRTHVYFGAHNGDVSRSTSIVSSVVYNSTSRYF